MYDAIPIVIALVATFFFVMTYVALKNAEFASRRLWLQLRQTQRLQMEITPTITAMAEEEFMASWFYNLNMGRMLVDDYRDLIAGKDAVYLDDYAPARDFAKAPYVEPGLYENPANWEAK